jgi:4-hydroxy-4-methyl-2-oxoglutarate aldolase
VRDLSDLQELGLPIWSKAVTAAGSVKATPGWVNTPIDCAGVLVSPGDLVVADDDGVIVVHQHELDVVRRASIARIDKESQSRDRINRGELSFDMQELRQYLEGKEW